VNAETGQEIWTHETGAGGQMAQGPSVAYGNVYVSTYLVPKGKPSIFALNKETGNVVWTWETHAGVDNTTGAWNAPNVADGKVFIQNYGTGGWLQALDAYNGKLLWETDLRSIPWQTEPVIAGGKLYAQSGDGYLYCFGKGKTTTTEQIIIVAVAVAIVIGTVSFYLLRRRRRIK